jgi:hypothetical protein
MAALAGSAQGRAQSLDVGMKSRVVSPGTIEFEGRGADISAYSQHLPFLSNLVFEQV